MMSGLDGVAAMPLAAVTRLLAMGNADLATAGSTVVADLAGPLLAAFEGVALTAVTRLFTARDADLATAGSTVVVDFSGSLPPAFEGVAGAARQTELVLPGRDTFAKLG